MKIKFVGNNSLKGAYVCPKYRILEGEIIDLPEEEAKRLLFRFNDAFIAVDDIKVPEEYSFSAIEYKNEDTPKTEIKETVKPKWRGKQSKKK